MKAIVAALAKRYQIPPTIVAGIHVDVVNVKLGRSVAANAFHPIPG